jgi:hypothetical protein
MTTETNPSTKKSSKPTHLAYHVRDGKGEKGFFNRIGAAWPHADGNGFTVQLDVVPLDGRITLRLNEDSNS